ncbi:MAG TPA: hypothetical protein PLF11_00130 [Bacillota bacterium]|nr:hypothetical protein [Dermatophilaceae bacterium]HOI35765.1 hypothetical protein [Bacillota bacterium]
MAAEDKDGAAAQEGSKEPAAKPSPGVDQSVIDGIVQDRLKREREKHGAALKEMQDKLAEATARLTELENAGKTEAEKTAARASAAEAAVQQLTAERERDAQTALRYKAILEHGAELPKQLHPLVQGTDEQSVLDSVKACVAMWNGVVDQHKTGLLRSIAAAQTLEDILALAGEDKDLQQSLVQFATRLGGGRAAAAVGTGVASPPRAAAGDSSPLSRLMSTLNRAKGE